MRKRVVGATVAVVAGLALSGCASGGGQAQTPGAPAGGNQQVAQLAGGEGSGDNGRVARPCEASDLDAKFTSHETPGDLAGNGNFFVAKTSDNMTPCVLDGFADIKFMAGSEGGQTLPVKVEQIADDGQGASRPMVLDGFGDQAAFYLNWTGARGCDTPGALSVTPPQASGPAEVPVNTNADNQMSVCAGSTVQIVKFGDYTD